MNHIKELEKVRRLFRKGAYKPDFYNKKLNDIKQLNDYGSFCKIPFMQKHELRNTTAQERSTTSIADVYGIFSSSGTTGEKTFYIYSNNDKKVHEEFVKAFFTELGICEEDIGGVMAPVDTGVMAHTMMWQFISMGAGYINCPIPSPQNVIDTVTKVPVTLIATLPSIATNVAYIPRLKEAAQKSKVRKLLMGGGFLSNERRKLLEETWNAHCYNMFGMSEMFGPMAGECEYKDGLHYLDEYLMIEIIDPVTQKPVSEGETGVAVYTTLWDKGFPLLRYWTNDLMKVTYKKCKCGSTNPRLYFLGRLDDSFKTDDGYIFPESVENILFKYGFIGEYCVYKRSTGYLIKTEKENATMNKKMQEELNEVFDNKLCIEVVALGSLNYRGQKKRFFIEK